MTQTNGLASQARAVDGCPQVLYQSVYMYSSAVSEAYWHPSLIASAGVISLRRSMRTSVIWSREAAGGAGHVDGAPERVVLHAVELVHAGGIRVYAFAVEFVADGLPEVVEFLQSSSSG